jgi:hypothetical protein
MWMRSVRDACSSLYLRLTLHSGCHIGSLLESVGVRSSADRRVPTKPELVSHQERKPQHDAPLYSLRLLIAFYWTLGEKRQQPTHIPAAHLQGQRRGRFHRRSGQACRGVDQLEEEFVVRGRTFVMSDWRTLIVARRDLRSIIYMSLLTPLSVRTQLYSTVPGQS